MLVFDEGLNGRVQLGRVRLVTGVVVVSVSRHRFGHTFVGVCDVSRNVSRTHHRNGDGATETNTWIWGALEL